MVKFYRIKLTAWTASFRYPNIISGYQPSLSVPPVSTVLGIINSCAGRYLDFEGLDIGYYFEYSGKDIDLETIYQVELDGKNTPANKVKSNVIRREILSDVTLYIYLPSRELADYFRKPVFQLLIGRSSDLATVEEILEVELPGSATSYYIRGQVVPFCKCHLPGIIQALPQYFTNTFPRRNIGTQPYSVIPFDTGEYEAILTTYRDTVNGRPVDIYIHKLSQEE